MENAKLIQHLQKLTQLDVDAIAAYEAAIDRIDVPSVKTQLDGFRVDHGRHIQDLNALIEAAGGARIDPKPDVKGLFLKGATAAASALGTEAALLAMLGNEELTTHTYQAARKLDLTPEQRKVIEKNYEDEQRHLAWIKMAAKERPWTKESGAAPG